MRVRMRGSICNIFTARIMLLQYVRPFVRPSLHLSVTRQYSIKSYQQLYHRPAVTSF